MFYVRHRSFIYFLALPAAVLSDTDDTNKIIFKIHHGYFLLMALLDFYTVMEENYWPYL